MRVTSSATLARILVAFGTLIGPVSGEALSAGPTAPHTTFLTGQTNGEKLASRLLGVTVVGANNETFGDVSDLIIDADNRVTALVVGVGGFLGVGEKSVAVPLDTVRLVLGDGRTDAKPSDGMGAASRVILEVTRSELQSAPAFRSLPRPGPALPSFGSSQR